MIYYGCLKIHIIRWIFFVIGITGNICSAFILYFIIRYKKQVNDGRDIFHIKIYDTKRIGMY